MLTDAAGCSSCGQPMLEETLFTSTTPHTGAGEENGRPDHCRKRLWDRTLLDALLLFALFAFVCAVSLRPGASMDEDLWWHLRTGDWIRTNSAIPVHDTFAAATSGRPWVAYTWLFDVLVSKTYAAFGLHGILALTTLLVLAFIAVVVALLSRNGNIPRASGLGALVFIAVIPLISPRPWLVSCIFFAVELYLLLQARERGRVLWLLPLLPLFILWANLHIQFVYGLGIIGMFAMEGSLATLLNIKFSQSKLRVGCYWALLFGAVAGTLANPYGWRLYTVVYRYAMQSAPLGLIQEMQALRFRSISDWTTLVLVCSAFFSIGRGRRNSLLMISLLLVSVSFSFRAGRDVWFTAVISALALASNAELSETGSERLGSATWVSVMLASLALASFVFESAGLSPTALAAAASKRFPVDASAYIESHDMKTPLYNSFGWGGYLMWRLQRMPVSIDGRAELHGDTRLTRFVKTWTGKRDWAGDTELMNANTILLERDSSLTSILRSDARFRLVYDDDIATVFEPARPHEPMVPDRP